MALGRLTVERFPAGERPRGEQERDKTMNQNHKTTTEKDSFTMQAADPAELEQIDGGLVLWPHQLDDLYARPN